MRLYSYLYQNKCLCLLLVLLTGCVGLQTLKAATYTYLEGRGLVYGWEKKDWGLAYPSNYTRVILFLTEVKADARCASFSGGGWALASGATYSAYMPYDEKHDRVNAAQLPVTYQGQTQVGNGNTAHLASVDFMAGRSTLTESSANFTLNHLGAAIKIEWTAERTMTVKSIAISTKEKRWATDVAVNVFDEVLTPTNYDDHLTLQLNEVSLQQGETLTAYMMVAPTDLSGDSITVTLTASDGTTMKKRYTGCALQAGRLYSIPERQNVAARAVSLPVYGSSPKYPVLKVTDFVEASLATDELQDITPILGDVDGDKRVTMADANMLMEYVRGNRTRSIDLDAADADGNGTITADDARRIVEIYIKNSY